MNGFAKAHVSKPVHGKSGRNEFFTFPLVDGASGTTVATLHCAMLQKAVNKYDLDRAFTVFGNDLFPLLGAKMVAGRGRRSRATPADGGDDDGDGDDDESDGLVAGPFGPDDEEDNFGDEGTFLVAVYGYDRPGVLEYTTNLFRLNGVQIASCFGAQLKSKFKNKLGCYFDLTHKHSAERVGALCEKLMANEVPPFTVRPLRAFDRVFDLNLEFAKDEAGLLFPVSSFLANLGVNFQSFNARPDDFSGLPGFPQVKVDARVELPVGVESHEVFTGLLKPGVTPVNTFVGLRELRRFQNNTPVRGTQLFEATTVA